MHGRIFELREQILPKDEWITQYSFCEHDDRSWYDYMRESDDREEDLQWLKNVLPPSIFRVSGEVVEIISDGREFVEAWIEELKKEVNALSYDEFKPWDPLYRIQSRMKNMLRADFMFVTDYEDYPHDPTTFIRHCINQYKGKKLYICGIVDYHY